MKNSEWSFKSINVYKSNYDRSHAMQYYDGTKRNAAFSLNLKVGKAKVLIAKRWSPGYPIKVKNQGAE